MGWLSVRAAERRWRKRNAEQPRICPCGAEGTVIRYADGQIGRVAPEFWRCETHKRLSLETPWVGHVPLALKARWVENGITHTRWG